ncbi:MAG: hypothetical protein IIC24_10485, partial [Chloroflexi bacterium]|nr:hypothetical protein [Chloroflexota bacterium]
MRTSRVIITGVISMIAVVILAGVALARDPSAPPAAPPVTDTGFTYQGFVRDGEQPASGAYDFQFALFNAINGIQVGSTIAKNDLPVVNGLVSTLLDFGPGVFDGSELWLETRTRKGDQTGAFDTLTPRQRINPVPYATYAYDGPFWMLGGNAGTTPDSNFVGTTDSQPLVFKVNNHEAMRIVPGGTTGDNVGINAPNPQAKLHVRWADSGAEPPAQVKSLIVETNHDGDGIALLQSDGKSVRITFGSPADNAAGRVLYKTSPDNYMAFWTAGSEKMRIGPTGNVGIGEDKPCEGEGSESCLLHVSKSGANRVRIDASSGEQAGLDLRSGSSRFIINYDDNRGLHFYNGDRSVNDLFIRNSDGFVGINTGSSPSAPLDVHGENASGYGAIFTNISPNGQGVLIQATDGQGILPLLRVEDNSQNVKFVVREDGNVGVGTSDPKVAFHVVKENNGEVTQYIGPGDSSGRLKLAYLVNEKAGRVTAWGDGAAQQLQLEGSTIVLNTGEGTGNVGIGVKDPNEKLAVAGIIQSTTGGFKFPDGSVQATAASGGDVQQVCVISGNNCDFQSRNIITNGRIGIGTDSPSAKLEIQSTFGSPFLSTVKNGNGTAGTFAVTQTDGTGHALLAYTQGMGRGAEVTIQNSSNPNSALYVATTGTGEALFVSGKSLFSGNVTIGDAFTNYQLTVNGTIKSREVVVTTTLFPDYVFDDDYDLMSLPDLEQTISQEGHLPGIPSAEEVAVSGIRLGDMQTRLLKKIEELTLYTIEQDKQLDQLTRLVNEQSGKINQMEIQETPSRTYNDVGISKIGMLVTVVGVGMGGIVLGVV